MAGWGRGRGGKSGTRAKAHQGSLKSTHARPGQALFSRTRVPTVLSRLSVGLLSPLLDCGYPKRPSFPSTSPAPGTAPGTWRASPRLDCVFRKCTKRMVWGRREGVHSVVRALKTLHFPPRPYPAASSCLPRYISRQESHVNFEHKTLS